MSLDQTNEERVLSAARNLAESIKSDGSEVPDISTLVEPTNSLPLSKFDYWERLIRRELAPTERPSWRDPEKPQHQITWADLTSGNGMERERALLSISGTAAPNSFFLVVAIRRLNDWAPEIRYTARKTVPAIAKRSNPIHVAEALCALLPHWNTWQRLGESNKKVFLEFLDIADVPQALKNRITSATSGSMSSVLSQVGRSPVLDTYLYEIAQSAVQPAVRAKAYRSILEEKFTWVEGRKWQWTDVQYCKGRFVPITAERALVQSYQPLEVLKQAVEDKSSIVRRVAGEMLIRDLEKFQNAAPQIANLLARDKSPPVSERGKFALRAIK